MGFLDDLLGKKKKKPAPAEEKLPVTRSKGAAPDGMTLKTAF